MKKMMILAAALCTLAAAASALEAKVVSATGKAEVQSGSAWTPLKAGDTLQKGAVIQTGFKSELVLQIKGTTVTVAPLSRMTIEQLAEKDVKDETRVYLETGSLKSDVQKSENRRVGFTVRSSVATASVRGTVLTVRNSFRGSDIQTHQGTVAVWKSRNDGAQLSTAAEDAAPAAPASDGTAASDISDATPRGAYTVSRGQQTTISSTGAVTSTGNHAAKAAFSLGATQTAAQAERVSLSPGGGERNNAKALTMQESRPESGTGSVVLTVSW